MTEKRYQVFISSTFRDLIAERQAVLLAIQKLNHIPAGMELIPSANDAPWGVIERIIDNSDCYVVIVGGRYGSTDENGVSYTEREYDLAVNKGIPVLGFLHADPGELPAKQSDMDPAARERLDGFRSKIEKAHHCTYWRTHDELATQVVVSLVNEIAQNPKKGWVRGDIADDHQHLLGTLEKVRQENESLRSQIKHLEQHLAEPDEEIQQGTDEVTLYVAEDLASKHVSPSVSVSWQKVFEAIGYQASSGVSERIVSSILGEAFFQWRNGRPGGSVSAESVKRVRNQFVALGLLDVDTRIINRPAHGSFAATVETFTVWHFTEQGKRLYALSQAARRNVAEVDRESP